ncbi:MAG: sigma-E factor negative regulatory protein [Gammaproteobacteria bacterium]
MKYSLNEQLSALVDDELPGSEHDMLLRRIENDEQLYQRLSRYQLISDALQSHLPERVDPAFSRRVKVLLRSEPAMSGYSRLATLARPAAGLAVAASVAVMAVMSLQSVQQGTPSPAEVVASAPPPAGDYVRVSDEPGNPSVDRKLDIYLVNHNEYAVNRGMQGMLPYVRIVGHEMNHGVRE